MIGIGLVAFPLLACLLVVATRFERSRKESPWLLGLVGATGAFLFAVTGVVQMVTSVGDEANKGASVGEWALEWIPSLGVGLRFGVDGLVLATVFAITAAYVACFFAMDRHSKGVERRAAALLLSEVGVLAAITTQDLLVFLPAWLLSWLPLTLSVAAGTKDDKTRKYTRRVSIQLSAAAAFFLAAVLGLSALYYGQRGVWTFDLARLSQLALSDTSSVWLFVFFFVSLGSGAALFPFHSWLPFASRCFPLPMLVALMVGATKAPLFMLAKVWVSVLPKAGHLLSPLVVAVVVVGGIHAGLLSWTHRGDWRRLAAYVTSGFGALALFGFVSLETRAFVGAAFLTATHVLAVGALVLGLVGQEDSSGSKSAGDKSPSAGISRGRLIGAFLAVGTLAAVPPSGGFIGEFLLWNGAFESYRVFRITSHQLGGAPLLLSHPKLWTLVALASSLVLSAATVHAFYKRFFLGYFGGRASCEDRRASSPREPTSEALPVLTLAALGVLMGLYPRPFLEPMKGAARRLIETSQRSFMRQVPKKGAVLEVGAQSRRRRHPRSPRKAKEERNVSGVRTGAPRPASGPNRKGARPFRASPNIRRAIKSYRELQEIKRRQRRRKIQELRRRLIREKRERERSKQGGGAETKQPGGKAGGEP